MFNVTCLSLNTQPTVVAHELNGMHFWSGGESYQISQIYNAFKLKVMANKN